MLRRKYQREHAIASSVDADTDKLEIKTDCGLLAFAIVKN
jgi:hypothetical protein